MVIYFILTGLNLVGMAFLFYIYERQKEINTEFLKNAILYSAITEMTDKSFHDLENRIAKLETELQTLKKPKKLCKKDQL
jgi:hypothetical protein